MVRKMAVEAIGTFFLVLTIGQVVIEPGAGELAPIAVANFLGGVAAALVFNALNLGSDKPTAATATDQAGFRAPAEPAP